VIELAERIDLALAQWIYHKITFPSTMVDRIVPATTATDNRWIEEHLGYQDEGLVVAEPFSQWVIEDNFCNGRPAWEQVGALIVKDVGVYETMKLRLLNGSHSLLAYTGFMAGYETIYQVMQDADFVVLTQQFMHCAAQTLEAPENFNLYNYQQQLITRFSNPGLQHRTEQIAMDGSQKIPQRWLNSLHHAQNIGHSTEIFAFALAAWLRYLHGTDESGNSFVISDPLASPLMQIVQENTHDIDAMVAALFGFAAVFGDELNHNSTLQFQTSKWLKRIYSLGIKPAIALFISQAES
jgi:fructuronate reductase